MSLLINVATDEIEFAPNKNSRSSNTNLATFDFTKCLKNKKTKLFKFISHYERLIRLRYCKMLRFCKRVVLTR